MRVIHIWFWSSFLVPESLLTLGQNSFAKCLFECELIIPSNTESIGELAFYENILKDHSQRYEEISSKAFFNCRGFSELKLSINMNKISASTFSGCSGFRGTLNIPSFITIIDSSAFYRCSDFTGTLTLPEQLTTISTSAFSGCRGFTGSLIIPSKVNSIGEEAFYECSGNTKFCCETRWRSLFMLFWFQLKIKIIRKSWNYSKICIWKTVHDLLVHKRYQILSEKSDKNRFLVVQDLMELWLFH